MYRSIRWVLLAAALCLDIRSADAAPQCPACDRVIVLNSPQADCMQKRLESYLKTPRDPIIISVVGCGEASGDSHRLEAPPSAFAQTAKPSASPPSKVTYLLAKGDAECLLRQLKTRNRRQPFKFDPSACEQAR